MPVRLALPFLTLTVPLTVTFLISTVPEATPGWP